ATDARAARRITVGAPARDGATPLMGPGSSASSSAEALHSWAVANGSDEKAAEEETTAREKAAVRAREQKALGAFEVRKSLEPAYTELALNGAEGPLADERVRRAVARALDRRPLAEAVLKPLGLPAQPVGSHLALAGQAAYAGNSGALGGQGAKEARAPLADAGRVPGGPVEKEQGATETAAGSGGKKAEGAGEDTEDDDGTYIVGEDEKKDEKKDKKEDGKKEDGEEKDQKKDGEKKDGGDDGKAPGRTSAGDRDDHLAQDGPQHQQVKQGTAPGAYAPKGTAAPAGAETAPLAKNGKALTLRFVLPSGPGSDVLRTVADRITKMLSRVGIRTDVTKVEDDSFFKDHIASGQYDLALYSWPATAYPATDARPVYAKPVPAADGSLNVEQNYTRVGTDQVDQLFDQAITTLDDGERSALIRKADSRIWAAAGSIPLYQRPQLTAARKNLVNAGSFGFRSPVYEDMGFLKKGAKGPAGERATAGAK